jgi:hypothetical protein
MANVHSQAGNINSLYVLNMNVDYTICVPIIDKINLFRMFFHIQLHSVVAEEIANFLIVNFQIGNVDEEFGVLRCGN